MIFGRISPSRSKLTTGLFRIAVFGDTQCQVTSLESRKSLQAQMAWVTANRSRLAIEQLAIVGDVADDSTRISDYTSAYQDIVVPALAAKVAAEAEGKRFDTVAVTGNHDEMGSGAEDRDTTNFNAVGSSVGHGLGDLAGNLTGLCEAGKIQNCYKEAVHGDRNVLTIGLEFCPRNDKVNWAKQVIEAHPGWFTILVTHGLLYRDGTIYTRPPSGGQQWNPLDYLADGNTGQDIVDKLITPYPQVKLALCGHAFPGHAHNLVTRADGSKCLVYLVDHQNNLDGSVDLRGFFSLITVDLNNDTVSSVPVSGLGVDWVDAYAAGDPQHYATMFVEMGLG